MQFPYFRDFAIYDNYPRLWEVSPIKWDWNYLEMILYSLDPTCGKSLIWVYLALWVIIGYWLNLRYWPRLIQSSVLSLKNGDTVVTSTSRLVVWVWAGLYFVNFWTIERVLMGHINVLKGHIMLIPILVVLMKPGYPYDWLVKALLIFWLGMVSPHYLGFLVLIYGVICLRRFQFKPLEFFKFLGVLVPFVLWQGLRIWLDSGISSQINSLGNSTNKQYILEAMSPHIRSGQDLVSRVLVGSASWNSPTFDELTRIKSDSWWNIGYLWYSNLWANWLLIVWVSLLILVSLKKSLGWAWPWLTMFVMAMVLSYGQSLELFKTWNWLVSSLPLMSLYRESGKFYGLVLFSLAMIGLGSYGTANWLEKLKLGVTSLVLILNLWGGVNILSQFNLVQYPAFDRRISEYCLVNRSLKRGVFIPNNIYIQTGFGNGIFGPNHYNISSECPFITPENSQVAGDGGIGYLMQSASSKQWSKLVKELTTNPEICQSVTWWLEFNNWSNNYDFWAWDATYYQDIESLGNCIKSHGLEPVISENNLEFYESLSRSGSPKL